MTSDPAGSPAPQPDTEPIPDAVFALAIDRNRSCLRLADSDLQWVEHRISRAKAREIAPGVHVELMSVGDQMVRSTEPEPTVFYGAMLAVWDERAALPAPIVEIAPGVWAEAALAAALPQPADDTLTAAVRHACGVSDQLGYEDGRADGAATERERIRRELPAHTRTAQGRVERFVYADDMLALLGETAAAHDNQDTT